MANLECATLVLRSSDITNSQIGQINTAGTSMTFNNIDLRTVLGDMYNRYDLFNICLTTLATNAVFSSIATNGYANNSYDNLYASVNISGLPWKNQTYSHPLAHNTNMATIATFSFSPITNSSAFQNYNNPKFLTFAKSQDTCNITIQFNRLIDNTICLTGGGVSFPYVTFLFSIYGIPKEPGNENGSRIIM